MPEADEEHGGDLGQQNHHRDRHRFLPRPEPAGDGIKEVSAEPLGESHVPVVPELSQVGFEIGRGKVLRQFNSEQLCDAESNVCVATEVEVDLKGVGVDDDPHPEDGGDLGCVSVIQGNECQRVGDDEFFEQAEEQALTCGVEGFKVQTRKGSAQVFDETFKAVNGTGGEGGEEDDVGDELAHVYGGEATGLFISNGVDEAKGNVGEAKPSEVVRGDVGQ